MNYTKPELLFVGNALNLVQDGDELRDNPARPGGKTPPNVDAAFSFGYYSVPADE